MAPGNLFRTMQPLRSSVTGLTTSSPSTMATLLPQFARLSVGMTTSSSRRTLSTTAGSQEASQAQTAPTTAKAIRPRPTPTTQNIAGAKIKPPSLRPYPYSIKTGTVVSVGKMDRTVRVAYRHTNYDPHLRKTYPKVTNFLVADPRDSLREGDVIEFASGFPKSRTVSHVVERIVAPFGSPIDHRPSVMSREERDVAREQKRVAKWQRKEQRRVESGGQDPGVKEHVGRIRRLVLQRTTTKATKETQKTKKTQKAETTKGPA